MENKNQKPVIDNMLKLSSLVSEKVKENGQEIDNIGYYKNFEFKGAGLAINDAYIVKLKDDEKAPKTRDNEDQQEKEVYEIYDKDNRLVATVNEAGEVEYSEEFIESLKEISDEYFDTLTLEDTEFELPEELGKDDIVLTGEEIEEKQIKLIDEERINNIEIEL